MAQPRNKVSGEKSVRMEDNRRKGKSGSHEGSGFGIRNLGWISVFGLEEGRLIRVQG